MGMGLLVLSATCMSTQCVAAPQDESSDDFAKWEPAIRAFEEADVEQRPPEGAVLFAGSSSIVFWDLPKWFPGLATINRGFGGSQVREVTHFAGRTVLPYKPKTIVFYAGDNDVALGRTAEQVRDDFRAFVAKVHGALPETRILFLSIKPSPVRMAFWDEMKKANELVRLIGELPSESPPPFTYVDVATPMFDDEGNPRAELFREDGLHLNEKGYRIWTEILTPVLEAGFDKGKEDSHDPLPCAESGEAPPGRDAQ